MHFPGQHHRTNGNLALAETTSTSLQLLGVQAVEPANGARLMEHTLGGIVDVSDMEAVLRPIQQATGAYSRLVGRQQDLAWEKGQWVIAVQRIIDQGRNEAEAVQASLLLPANLWPKLPTSGKSGEDQRNLPNFRRWRKTMGVDKAGRVRKGNWEALAKRRGGGQVQDLDEGFMRDFFSRYLHPNAPGIEPARRDIAKLYRLRGQDGRIPSEEQVRRAVAKCVTGPLDLKYRSKRERFNNLVKGYIRREVNAEAGAIWFMDHRECDFWVRTRNAAGEEVAKRPYITAVFDARSFCCIKAIIYVDTHPNHERILEAFQEACRMAGNRPPRVLYIDNGKDFLKLGLGTPVQLTEKQNKGRVLCDAKGEPYRYCVMDAMHVTVKTARGYNGKEKPIERWFRDMAHDWETSRVGYCGNSPATRPDFGDTWKGEISRLDTVGQAMASFESWIHDVANAQPRENGMTRGEIWAKRPLEMQSRMEDLDLFVRTLLPQRVAPVVRRTSMGGGVAYASWQYSHADLHRYWDQPVMVKTCWWAPRVTVPVQTRNGKQYREVPAFVFVFSLDNVLLCGAIADPVHDMFAESDESKARLAAAQHVINAVAAQNGVLFEQLTGRKQIADTSKLLAELDEHAMQQTTVAISADPSAPNRRLRGDCKGIAPAPQKVCTDPSEYAEYLARNAEAADEQATGMHLVETDDYADWLSDDDDEEGPRQDDSTEYEQYLSRRDAPWETRSTR